MTKYNFKKSYPQPSLALGGTNIDNLKSVKWSVLWHSVGDEETSEAKDARSETNCHDRDSCSLLEQRKK